MTSPSREVLQAQPRHRWLRVLQVMAPCGTHGRPQGVRGQELPCPEGEPCQGMPWSSSTHKDEHWALLPFLYLLHSPRKFGAAGQASHEWRGMLTQEKG